ncbi:uridine permease NDAI_0J00590 [Naumovozyma dairenensis CBS 421]|uniref:Allantoin permease n=1 Tax=Naumovozyma dairenensis (strain ATCC 10597 / BCRC 20456 / CBS 421 / NBRC 0211 / NRRL Y-12639) TaxID=1071378 RepID=G0WGM3_NAUDC|nr:hypothetical protein NDAI_0J00590 [Naumovozyma dairenensis CBS 421]CCD26951.1 hypothetical protein NDAI_0J00590 [Naumovozyma dairenensis CBS 421]
MSKPQPGTTYKPTEYDNEDKMKMTSKTVDISTTSDDLTASLSTIVSTNNHTNDTKISKPKRFWNKFINFIEVKQSETSENSDENSSKSILQAYLYNDDLAPVKRKERVWSWNHYVFFWVAGAFNVNTWQISATGLQLGLNWWQTWICIWVGYSFVAGFLVLASRVGSNYHISFPIASRIAFGTYFSIWIVINRVVMACVWMGTLSYLGGVCVQLMLKSIFGNDLNTRIHDTIGSNNLTNFEFLCFMIFWIVSLPFLWFPPHKLKYVFTVKSAITPFAAFGFLIWTLCKANGHLALRSLNENGPINKVTLAWSVIRSIMSALDNFSTLILNAPDFARFSKTSKSSIYSQLIALPFLYAVISLIGILSATAAYTLYGINYWSPLDILGRYLDHKTAGNRAGVFLISFVFAFDQLGANLSGNAIPAGTDMTALLPKFINIRRGAYICACISLAICPWNLMASSSIFTTALSAYAVFLSAIAGVIFADYFVVRKGYVNIFHCYTNKEGSYYMYNKWGTNWRAVLAYIFGIAPNFAGFLGSVNVVVPENAMKVYYLNYFTGYLISAITYVILVYFWPITGVPEDSHLIKDLKWIEHEEWIEVEDFAIQRDAFERYSDETIIDYTEKDSV